MQTRRRLVGAAERRRAAPRRRRARRSRPAAARRASRASRASGRRRRSRVELGPRRGRGRSGAPGCPVVRRSSRPKHGGTGGVQPGEPGPEPPLAVVVGPARAGPPSSIHSSTRWLGASSETASTSGTAIGPPGSRPVAEPPEPGGLGGEEVRRCASDATWRTPCGRRRGRRRRTGRRHRRAPGGRATTGAPTDRPIASAELRVHVTMVTRGRCRRADDGWARRDSNPRSLRNWFTASPLWPLGYGPGRTVASRPEITSHGGTRAPCPASTSSPSSTCRRSATRSTRPHARSRNGSTSRAPTRRSSSRRRPSRSTPSPSRACRRCGRCSRRRW